MVAGKGYHSNDVLRDLAALEMRSYISEPERGRRNWCSGPIHFDVQDRDRFARHQGQLQLQGPLDLCLLPRRDILCDPFRRPLHRLGGQFQTRQQFQLPASVTDREPPGPPPPAYGAPPRRVFGWGDVEFGVGGKLAAMTVPAQVVGARHIHPAGGRENRFGAQFPGVSLVAATTRKGALLGRRGCPWQQFGEGGGGRVQR